MLFVCSSSLLGEAVDCRRFGLPAAGVTNGNGSQVKKTFLQDTRKSEHTEYCCLLRSVSLK